MSVSKRSGGGGTDEDLYCAHGQHENDGVMEFESGRQSSIGIQSCGENFAGFAVNRECQAEEDDSGKDGLERPGFGGNGHAHRQTGQHLSGQCRSLLRHLGVIIGKDGGDADRYPHPAGGEEAKQEEQTEFTVELVSSGEKKIEVVKAIRALTQVSLKEAKDLADNAPSVVKQGVSKADAEAAKKALEEAGGKVTVK